MTSEESQYAKWSSKYLELGMRSMQAPRLFDGDIFDQVLPPGHYDVQQLQDSYIITPGEPPFPKVEDDMPTAMVAARRKLREQNLRKKGKLRDCCLTYRNTRGHQRNCELYSGILPERQIHTGDEITIEMTAELTSEAMEIFYGGATMHPRWSTLPEEKKMSTRKQLNQQLDALRQQLTVLAEAQAKYNVLPEEDNYPNGTIGRFVLRIQVKEPKGGPDVRQYGDAQYDASSYHKVDKDLTFLILKAQDGLWYTTGSNFFRGQRTGLSWEDLVDKILDNEAELRSFEFLPQENLNWDVIYTK